MFSIMFCNLEFSVPMLGREKETRDAEGKRRDAEGERRDAEGEGRDAEGER